MKESLSVNRRHEQASVHNTKRHEAKVKKLKRNSKHKKSSKKNRRHRKHKRSESHAVGPIPEFILIRSSSANDGTNSDFKPLWASGQSAEADLKLYRDEASPHAELHNRAPVETEKKNDYYAQSPPLMSTEAPNAHNAAVPATSGNQTAVSALLSLSDPLESPMPPTSSNPIKVPCRARGMAGTDHRFETAHFLISEDIAHGQDLICSHEKCQEGGIKFSFCKCCQIPVAKRGFKTRHGHMDLIDQKRTRESITDTTVSPSNTQSTKVPCRARFMTSDHKFETAHFDIPADIQHGAELICSHPACRNDGVKFCFCTYCRLPVAKRNFRKRHLHLDDDNAMELSSPGASGVVCQPTAPAALLQVSIPPKPNQNELVISSPIASLLGQQHQQNLNLQSNVLLGSSIPRPIFLPRVNNNADGTRRVNLEWQELLGKVVVENNLKDGNVTNMCDV